MSFLHPGRLWLLSGVLVLVAAYVGIQLHRRAALARYASRALVPVVVPVRTGARRHVPPFLALLGITTLTLALAQPTHAEAVPKEEGVVILTVDVSASMDAEDIAPDRLDAAVAGAKSFVGEVPDGIHIGLVAFDGGARVVVPPTTDRPSVLTALDRLRTGPGTAAGEALYASLDAAVGALSEDVLAQDDVPASIVLLSDGVTTVGRPVLPAADAAAEAGIPVTTIAFGTPTGTVTVDGELVLVPADTETMAEVADRTGGTYFEATTAGQLEDVYRDIQTDVGYTTEQREVTRSLVGVALATVLGAAALGLLWTARPL